MSEERTVWIATDEHGRVAGCRWAMAKSGVKAEDYGRGATWRAAALDEAEVAAGWDAHETLWRGAHDLLGGAQDQESRVDGQSVVAHGCSWDRLDRGPDRRGPLPRIVDEGQLLAAAEKRGGLVLEHQDGRLHVARRGRALKAGSHVLERGPDGGLVSLALKEDRPDDRVPPVDLEKLADLVAARLSRR